MPNFSNKLFILLAFLIIFLRPGIPGQGLGSIYVGLILFVFTGVILLDKKVINIKRNMYAFWFFLFVFYLTFNMFIYNPSYSKAFWRLFTLNLLAFALFYFIRLKRIYIFLKLYIKVISILCLSGFITFILILVFKIQYETLEILTLNLQPTLQDSDNYIFKLLFPFTFIYGGFAYFLGDLVPRFIGLFREPGIFQIFILTALYLSNSFYKGIKLFFIRIVLLSGFLFCFSTSGFIAFFICEIVRVFFFTSIRGRYKRLKAFAIVILSIFVLFLGVYFLFLSDLQFSIAGKMSRESGISRVASVLTSIDFLQSSPLFGHGFGKFGDRFLFENVNLITAGAEIGFIGLIIYLFYFIYLLIRLFKNRSIYFLPLLVYFITILFSQPLYSLPISFFYLSIGTFFAMHDSTFNRLKQLVLHMS